uniref:ATP synthase subunit 6 n=1 Tax=Taeniothrips eucharii TaxID=1818613 RepID=UPI0030E03D2A
MLSLFMSFDPKSSILELNWICFVLPIVLTLYIMWINLSRLNLLKNKLIKEIENQFKIALKTYKDSSNNMFTSIFVILMASNLMGLFPNMFTGTSHIFLNLTMSVSMWMGFMLYGWLIFPKKMLAHLVPSGTPLMLINFMVLIETISNTIRPFTLSIRLMANMVSGHLLLTLMGNTMSKLNLILLMTMTVVQMALISLEMGVALIQAYVFCMLLTLYSDESDH